MNNLTGNNISKYQRPFKSCSGILGNVSPNNLADCFRLVELQDKLKKDGGNGNYKTSFQQGDILADAKYILHDNSCGDSQEIDGNQVIYYMRNFIGSLFIPRVMMRCTIIPV